MKLSCYNPARSLLQFFSAVVFGLFCCPGAQSTDSRNMNIPTSEEEIQEFGQSTAGGRNLDLILHYNITFGDRLIGWLYSNRTPDQLLSDPGYAGIEPVSFSKPSESMYKSNIGFWGQNLKYAVRDNPQAHSLMKWYQARCVVSTVFLSAAVAAGFLTAYGAMRENFYFGDNMTSHLVLGTGGTVGMLGCWSIPLMFNRGKIYKAYKVYNRLSR